FSGPNIGKREQEDYLLALDGMLFGDSPDEGFVRGRSYIHPHLRIAFTLPQGYRLENTSKAVLAISPNGTAMRFDGVSVSRDVPLVKYLTSGWVTGLLTGSIRQQQINGNEAVLATAKAKGWTFRIAVIRIQSATYRFVFATTRSDAAFESNVTETFQSFHMLTTQQAMAFRPLNVKIIKAPQAASIQSYATQMQGTEQPERLFRLLNNLSATARIKKGQNIK
ncbi:MAG: metalloprotease, partial [Cohaesibacter sp.]|nr:metalloprotease [Cohaesibacter sp.]